MVDDGQSRLSPWRVWYWLMCRSPRETLLLEIRQKNQKIIIWLCQKILIKIWSKRGGPWSKSSPRKKTCSNSLHSWVGTQNKVSGSFRRDIFWSWRTKWVCMFYTKDRDSIEYCLRENDVVPLVEKQKIKEELSKVKHCKLILKTDQPIGYWLMD